MLEDIRNHDSAPSQEEMEWASTDAIALVVRSVGLAGLALAIGFAASVIVTPTHALELPASVVSR